MTFDRVGVNMIRTIPVSPTYRRDVLLWRFTKNGLFSARLGYFDASESEISVVTGTGDITHQHKNWTLRVPKIRVFLWKILHAIIPTKINLISMFVDVDPFCLRCGGGDD